MIPSDIWEVFFGARLKDLPPAFGEFQTVKRRYCRWLERGLIERLLEQPGQNTDLEWLLFDNTVIRTHQHAAGGCTEEKGRQKAQGLGRSKVGFSTKLHAASDALSNPSYRLLAGPGQENDMPGDTTSSTASSPMTFWLIEPMTPIG